MEKHNGIPDEFEHFCDTIAWGIVNQGQQFDNETRSRWIREGFVTQAELNRIQQLVKEYRTERMQQNGVWIQQLLDTWDDRVDEEPYDWRGFD